MFLRKLLGPFTVKEWVKKFRKSKFMKSNFKTWINAGWVEWECPEEVLTEKIYDFAYLIMAANINKAISNNYSISFANYKTYDVVCFNPLKKRESTHTYFTIECFNEQNKHDYVVFTERNDYREEIAVDSIDDIIKALLVFVPYINLPYNTTTK